MYPGSGLKSLESFVHLCFIMRNSFLFDLAGAESLNKFSFLSCDSPPEPSPPSPVRSHSSAGSLSLLSCHCALCLMLCKLLLYGHSASSRHTHFEWFLSIQPFICRFQMFCCSPCHLSSRTSANSKALKVPCKLGACIYCGCMYNLSQSDQYQVNTEFLLN